MSEKICAPPDLTLGEAEQWRAGYAAGAAAMREAAAGVSLDMMNAVERQADVPGDWKLYAVGRCYVVAAAIRALPLPEGAP